MPTTDELQTQIDDLTALVRDHTISRVQIDALFRRYISQLNDAINLANRVDTEVAEVHTRVDAVSSGLQYVLEGLAINETVTGAVNSSNRIFVTASPYIAGTLIVVVDNRVYYGSTYLTETPSFIDTDDNNIEKGKFQLTITPQTGQTVKALLYVKKGA